jgi:hypothetical protein
VSLIRIRIGTFVAWVCKRCECEEEQSNNDGL